MTVKILVTIAYLINLRFSVGYLVVSRLLPDLVLEET